MKQIVLSLFLFLSLSLQAQTERRDTLMSDSLQTDSVIPAKPSAFKRAIRKFMNFSDFDTLYISHNRYNYALMTTHFSNFEYYSVTSNLPQPQKLSFSPNPHNKIGLYLDLPGMVCRRGRHLPEDQPKEQGNRVRFKSIQFQAGSGHLLSSHR